MISTLSALDKLILEEKSKGLLIKKLMKGKEININELANKYKKFLDEKNRFKKKIVSLIKNKLNINSINNGEENAFNENSFYNYLSQKKQINYYFFIEIKNKKTILIKFSIIWWYFENYRSCNMKCLSNLYNHMEAFENFYQIYMNFELL